MSILFFCICISTILIAQHTRGMYLTKKLAVNLIASLQKRTHIIFLFLTWACGFLFGCAVAPQTGEDLRSVLLVIGEQEPSLLGGIITVSISLLLSSIIVRFFPKPCLLVIVFLKAFVVSFMNMSLWVAFGSAGWVMRAFLLFIPTTTSVIMLWFWHRLLYNLRPSRDILFALCATAGIVSIDYFVVSPFTAGFIINI